MNTEQPRQTEVIYLDKVNLYSWGKNKNGELGLGMVMDCITPTAVECLKGYDIAHVASGGKHSIVMSVKGEIFSCGSAEFGLLGNSVSNPLRIFPTFGSIESFEDEVIEEVVCAEFHSLCRTKDGFICSWGGNLYNKLGQYNQFGVPSIIQSLSTKKVLQISCGDHHSAIVTMNYEVYTWGGGGQYNKGQCGHGNCLDVKNPKRVSFFIGKAPHMVNCGGYHTIVLCKDNELYGFGKGSYGQCGYGETEDTAIPQKVMFDNESGEKTEVIKIACGGEHSVVLNSKGKVYSFGHGYHGQLGQFNNDNYPIATQVMALSQKTIVQIATGWAHTIVLSINNELYATGSNINGELGLGDKKSRQRFTYVKSMARLNIKGIYCGGRHSFAVINSTEPFRRDYAIHHEPLITLKSSITEREERKTERKETKTLTIEANTVAASQKKNSTSMPKKTQDKSQNDFGLSNNKSRKTMIYQKASIFNCDLRRLCNQDITSNSHRRDNEDDHHILLKVFYCDMFECTRFIRFTPIQKKTEATTRELILMIDKFLMKENGIRTYSLSESNTYINNPLYDKYRDIAKINDSIGINDYVLSMTFDHEHNITYTKALNQLFNKNCYSPYEVHLFSERDIQLNSIESILSRWVLQFMDAFKSIINMTNPHHLSFIEFRPNSQITIN